MGNKEVGKLGEDMAEKYLEDRGYEIIERNYRTRWGEIDLICQKNRETIFVEVKTRMDSIFGSPEDAINKNKIRRLIKNANAYAAFKSIDNYRIDAVCITLDEKSGKIKTVSHYENITM